MLLPICAAKMSSMKQNILAPYGLALGLVVLAALYLLAIGRLPICECGFVSLWHGDIMSDQNSQHLFDWYTPSHLLHGFIFFGFLWLIARKMPLGWRFFIATLIETAWEVAENSDALIERYRSTTASVDYFGDSVINVLADILAMAVGFFLAARLPVWVSAVIVIGFEVLTVLIIRDGLALNVVMLLQPIEAIKDWQLELWNTL